MSTQIAYDPNTSNSPLAPESRTMRPSALYWFWTASGCTIAASPAGIIIATTPGLSLGAAALALLLGALLAGSVLTLVSIAGVRSGQATLVLSEGVFGRRGNLLPLAISFLVLMGWCAVMSVMVVYCVDAILRKFGIYITDGVKLVVLGIFAIALVALVWIGYRFIQATQKWISLFVGGACLAVAILAGMHTDWSRVLETRTQGLAPFITAVVLSLTGAASGWWNSGADFSRFQRPGTKSGPLVRAVLAGMDGYVLVIILGAALGYWNPQIIEADNPAAAATVDTPTWLTIVALLVVTIGLHAGAVTNMYSASLNLNTLGVRHRAASVAISGSLIVLIACWVLFWNDNFYSWFSSFLTVLGVPVAAWTGVFVVPVIATAGWPRVKPGVAVWSLIWLIVASVIGFGLISSTTPGFTWVGYLAPDSELSSAGIGVVVAFAVAFVGAWITRSTVASNRDPQ